MGVSGLFGLSALDRSPFLWGVGVSFGASGTPMGQIIFLIQYSDRIPYGPTSLRLIISVVVISVSVVSKTN